MFDRRMFLRSLTATAAGLLAPAGLVEAEPVRRFWALGAVRDPLARRWGESDREYLQRMIELSAQMPVVLFGDFTIDRPLVIGRGSTLFGRNRNEPVNIQTNRGFFKRHSYAIRANNLPQIKHLRVSGKTDRF